MLFVLACVATLIGLFYAVENWRGKRAWETTKREFEAKGAVLDWAAYVPAPIPDDQNIFKAPQMTEWFVKKRTGGPWSNSFANRFTYQARIPVAEVVIVPMETSVQSQNSDLTLTYRYPILTNVADAEMLSLPAPAPAEIIPIIQMDEAPLLDAIRHLAGYAKIQYALDPKIPANKLTPVVSFKWQNVTAEAALVAMLDNHGLKMLPNPVSGVARITSSDSPEQGVLVDSSLRQRLSRLTEDAVARYAPNPDGSILEAPQGFKLARAGDAPMKTSRVLVRAERLPSLEEIQEFFAPSPRRGQPSITVEPNGTNSFLVGISNRDAITFAESYLAWTDQNQDALETVRAALKRPYARDDGDYENPIALPLPDFIAVRVLAQTLAARAQCHLLLGNPERALHEMTTLRDSLHLLDTGASGPNTLVAAMIKVAVAGLYNSVVADGLRLQAWEEPQLSTLQEHLRDIDLLTGVAHSYHAGAAGMCRTLETISSAGLERLFVHPINSKGESRLYYWWKNPTALLIALAPRGWIYQNMSTIVSLEFGLMEGIEANGKWISAKHVEKAAAEIRKALSRTTPYNFIAQLTVPNFRKAVENAAKNQTTANQAFVACALERYRLAKNGYPNSLEALVPQYLAAIPRDVMGGEPLGYRTAGEGQCVLYSIGWDEKDDDGDNDKDWVWMTNGEVKR